MKKVIFSGFTLVEILAATIILTLLAGLSFVAYEKTIEANNERVCQQNQKLLQAAIDIYAMENDVVPATLAMLNSRHIHLAGAKINGKNKENKLVVLFKDTLGIKSAIAQTLPSLKKYYDNETKILRCPADNTISSDQNYTSYNINYDFSNNEDIANESLSESALIYDRETYHKKALSSERYQIATTSKGKHKKQIKKADGSTVEEGGGSQNYIPNKEEAIKTAGFISNEANCVFSGQDCKTRWNALKGNRKSCKEAGYQKCKEEKDD